VVIGGGYSGVEVAGEINDFLQASPQPAAGQSAHRQGPGSDLRQPRHVGARVPGSLGDPRLRSGSKRPRRPDRATQAPGRNVHESGIPFDDASGDRFREWLGITREVFYDPKQVAILPMGFCYPGTEKSGDLPRRPECAPAWRKPLLNRLRHAHSR